MMVNAGGRRRRGTVTVLVLMALLAVCGLVALVVDFSAVYVAKQQLQTAADAAALAGAGQLRYSANLATARAAAVSAAETNLVLGRNADLDPSVDVVIGDYNSATGEVSSAPTPERTPVVKVTVRRTQGSPDGALPLTFCRLFGVNDVDVQASAIASLDSVASPAGRAPLELVIVQDGSYSFLEEIAQAKAADQALVQLISDRAVIGDRIAAVNFCAAGWLECNFLSVPASTTAICYEIATGDYCYSTYQMNTNPDRYYGTHTGAGIDKAISLFDQYGSPTAEHVIVLVSDGMPYPVERRPLATAAADRAAAKAIRIHTVTFDQEDGGEYGIACADAAFNASLVRNGGYAFHTPDPTKLTPILCEVGAIEVGRPHLIR